MLENEIYKELKVVPVIHAAGTKTTHGGTRSEDNVFEAMYLASRSFVSIKELNQSVGQYIAKITGAEAGMVTSGAASAMVLSTAACMTGKNIAKVKQLPNTESMRNEFIIQKIHCGSYNHIYSFSGANIIEVGNINDCIPEELEIAINEKTMGIGFLFGPRISRTGLTLKQVVKIGHKYNIPVIVDSAAMLPPRSNLKKYIEEGADLVMFSGGKMIHGPQNTGLLFGKKELIEAAAMNANPNYGIGRPHKVTREQIVGLYTALKNYLGKNEEEIYREYHKRIDTVYDLLKDLKYLQLDKVHDGINYHVPVLTIKFNNLWNGIEPRYMPDLLLEQRPRIFMQYFKELDDLVVNPISLQKGEPEILGKALFTFLERENRSQSST